MNKTKLISLLLAPLFLGAIVSSGAITISQQLTNTTVVPAPNANPASLDIGTFTDAQVGDMVVLAAGTNRPDSYNLTLGISSGTGSVGSITALSGSTTSNENVWLFYTPVTTAGTLTLNLSSNGGTGGTNGVSNATGAYLLRPGAGELITFAGFNSGYVPSSSSVQDGGTSLWQETVNLSVDLSSYSYSDAVGFVAVSGTRNETTTQTPRNNIIDPDGYTEDIVNGVIRLAYHSNIGWISGDSETVSVQSLPSVLANNLTAGLGVFVAVPEPSTYALLAGFATLGLVLLRRRIKND